MHASNGRLGNGPLSYPQNQSFVEIGCGMHVYFSYFGSYNGLKSANQTSQINVVHEDVHYNHLYYVIYGHDDL